MCRYAFKTYKSHFACFNCRKTFKQASYIDILQQIGKSDHYEKLLGKSLKLLTSKEKSLVEDIDSKYRQREIRCPECGGYMADLGLDFKSPKKTAIKEWTVIQRLYTIGISFYSCGCIGMGFIPQNENEYKEYLGKTLIDYQNSIAYYQQIPLKDCEDKIERINYWNERIKVLKFELSRKKIRV